MSRLAMIRPALVALALGVARAAWAQAGLPPPPASPAPVQRFEHDAVGNRTLAARVVGGADAGNVTSTYDALSRLTTQRDGAGGLVRLGRNGRGDVTDVTDPLELVTRYQRDGFGQPVQELSPDAGSSARSFDAAGRVTNAVDARGVSSAFSYDALGRLRQLDRGGAGLVAQTFQWIYDETDAGTSHGVGRLTTSGFPAGAARHAYDALGRPIREVRSLSALPAVTGPVTGTTGYGWDGADRLTTLVYPSGRTLRYLVANGRVSAMTVNSADGLTTSTLVDQVQWDPTGVARSWRWGLAGNSVHETWRDVNGRVVRQTLGPYVRDISYDARDRVAAYRHYVASTGAAAASLDQTFTYDEADRLVGWTAAGTAYTVGYDANGNRTSFTTGTSTQWLGRVSGTNRLSIAPNPLRTLQYDAAGNLASDSSGLTLVHDASGRLQTVVAAGSSSTVSNFYDGSGRRVAKYTAATSGGKGSTLTGATDAGEAFLPTNTSSGTADPNLLAAEAAAAKPSGWTLTVYYYDPEGRLLAEHSQGTVNAVGWKEYYWLGDTLVATYQQSTTPQLMFVHSDHLGAPRALVDTAGRPRWTWFADPFGLAAPNPRPDKRAAVTFDLRFPGQYFDRETGLRYNMHRYYDAGAGRYTQADPIGLAGGSNPYAYVEGNPVSFVDPLGLQTYKCIRPLKGLPGRNLRNGPDIWGDVAYHQYSCIIDPDPRGVGFTCGGQGPASSSIGNFLYGPGKPTDPKQDYFHPEACEKSQDRNTCFESCLMREWANPRPNYGWPAVGKDCKDFDNDVNARCRKLCGLK